MIKSQWEKKDAISEHVHVSMEKKNTVLKFCEITHHQQLPLDPLLTLVLHESVMEGIAETSQTHQTGRKVTCEKKNHWSHEDLV